MIAGAPVVRGCGNAFPVRRTDCDLSQCKPSTERVGRHISWGSAPDKLAPVPIVAPGTGANFSLAPSRAHRAKPAIRYNCCEGLAWPESGQNGMPAANAARSPNWASGPFHRRILPGGRLSRRSSRGHHLKRPYAAVGHMIRIDSSMSLCQCGLCPSPREINENLSLIFAFGAAGPQGRFFSVTPELVCFRHDTFPVCPDTSQHQPFTLPSWPLGICLKPLTFKAGHHHFRTGHQARKPARTFKTESIG